MIFIETKLMILQNIELKPSCPQISLKKAVLKLDKSF